MLWNSHTGELFNSLHKPQLLLLQCNCISRSWGWWKLLSNFPLLLQTSYSSLLFNTGGVGENVLANLIWLREGHIIQRKGRKESTQGWFSTIEKWKRKTRKTTLYTFVAKICYAVHRNRFAAFNMEWSILGNVATSGFEWKSGDIRGNWLDHRASKNQARSHRAKRSYNKSFHENVVLNVKWLSEIGYWGWP